MKLCDTCIYRNNVEQLKPCIIYRDNCEYYEREEDMKAIIQINVPNYQIGQEVSIYFKDTMMIKGIVQEPSGDLISREQALKECHKIVIDGDVYGVVQEETLLGLPSVNPQEPKTGHWIPRNSFLLQYKCSECGRESEKYNYCPNCGARMESEVSDEDSN